MAKSMVTAYNGDPFVGHLSTPISDSAIVKNWINSLPIYRPGLAPLRRGLEIGMAHGYFLLGPWYKLGPFRDTGAAGSAALAAVIGVVITLTIGLTLYGKVTFTSDTAKDPLMTAKGWDKFTNGFSVGGLGGAVFAYGLLMALGMFGF